VNPKLGDEIDKIAEKGDKSLHEENYDLALSFYEKAWSLIPEPKMSWMMPTLWIAHGFYLTYFNKSDYENALVWGDVQMKVKSSIDSGPLINMGMALFELGKLDEAFKYFEDAYNYGKKRAFQERPKKYLNFYLERSKQE
jgi:tetratricopeptide (TPR) repeat protein